MAPSTWDNYTVRLSVHSRILRPVLDHSRAKATPTYPVVPPSSRKNAAKAFLANQRRQARDCGGIRTEYIIMCRILCTRPEPVPAPLRHGAGYGRRGVKKNVSGSLIGPATTHQLSPRDKLNRVYLLQKEVSRPTYGSGRQLVLQIGSNHYYSRPRAAENRARQHAVVTPNLGIQHHGPPCSMRTSEGRLSHLRSNLRPSLSPSFTTFSLPPPRDEDKIPPNLLRR